MHPQLCLSLLLVFLSVSSFAACRFCRRCSRTAQKKTHKSIRFDLTSLLLPMYTSSLLFEFFSPLDFRSSFTPFMMLLLKILWRKSFCRIFVSVPASNSLFNSASLYSLSGSSTVTLWRGRRKRSYLGISYFFCSNFASISSFFFLVHLLLLMLLFFELSIWLLIRFFFRKPFFLIVWSLFGFSRFWLPSGSCWIFGALVDD
jgi:hypothetical protein